MKIAKGILSGGLGRIKHTPSRHEKSHHTWWIPEDSEPWKDFELIDANKFAATKHPGGLDDPDVVGEDSTKT